jgi:L-ascorbate metabolism protein UlaG (beta-lactamase superfamily)
MNQTYPIQPAFRKNSALLQDIQQALTRPDSLHIWWLGQSGFLLQAHGHHLLFDPYLSDSLTRKYAATDKPHIRMTELVVDPEQLTFIDVVTSSHNHTDHLDPDTLQALHKVNSGLHLVFPEANRALVSERSGLPATQLHGLNAASSGDAVTKTSATVASSPQSSFVSDQIELHGFRITAVPAAHEQLDTDAAEHFLYQGYVVEVGPWAVYHSGDTMLYPGMKERLKHWDIDVAILPINGRAPERRVSGNLWGEEAAQLAHDIQARLVIPCHYDLFTFNTASPDAFVRACNSLDQRCQVLRVGERWSS